MARPAAARRLASVMVESMTSCQSMRRSGFVIAHLRSHGGEVEEHGLIRADRAVAVLFDLGDVFGALGPHGFHHVRRRAVQEFFARKLAIVVGDQFFELLDFLRQPLRAARRDPLPEAAAKDRIAAWSGPRR